MPRPIAYAERRDDDGDKIIVLASCTAGGQYRRHALANARRGGVDSPRWDGAWPSDSSSVSRPRGESARRRSRLRMYCFLLAPHLDFLPRSLVTQGGGRQFLHDSALLQLYRRGMPSARYAFARRRRRRCSRRQALTSNSSPLFVDTPAHLRMMEGAGALGEASAAISQDE